MSCDWIGRTIFRRPEILRRHVLSVGRVALLGIAQRQIRIKYAQKSRNRNRSKPLPENIKSLGDLIQVKRHEKNLTAGHLALKMGIATTLVRSWEDGSSQPNSQQLKTLADLLGFKTCMELPNLLGLNIRC
jgi:ribosome-binding protein aMBF1 (putative translation factor)